MRRGPSRRLGLGMLLTLLTACGAQPGPTPSGLAPSSSNRFGAPIVERPVDVSAVAGSPCTSLLTQSELDRLGFGTPGRQRTSIDVQECAWTASDQQGLALAVDGDRDLLADTYRTHLEPVFVPTSIEGFPAVAQKSRPGPPNICVVTTGLGPKQALETTWIGRGDPTPGHDACEFAEQATALVIRKLPPQR
jgi:uncharacterized protein DUF3558